MDIRESIRIASIDIRLNKLRTFLSMLGIIIGIASVIIIVALGNGLKYKIINQFSGLGANRIYIHAGWDAETQRIGEITLNDISAIRSLSGITDVTPEVNWNTEVKGATKTQPMEIRGVAPDYFIINNLRLDSGRTLTAPDLELRQRVCVLKSESALSLFSEDTAAKTMNYASILGRTIKLGGVRFEIVGVLAKSDQGQIFGTSPNTIFVPVTILLRSAQTKNIPTISVQITDIQETKKIGNKIVNLLKERHGGKGRYHVFNPEDIQKEINIALNVFTGVIGAIGGLSLLVGGIGIMNIMLASVAERTREIGIRKAIGAKRRDILFQFLIEAGTISGCGGVIGIILGIPLAKSIDILTRGEIPSAILPSSIIIAFVFSVFVGMFFGIYPASKAANLNPIEALHYE
ncbi:MAG: ABC transporter permease [bacterium]|nr:ABC transporter permease [bacterium]